MKNKEIIKFLTIHMLQTFHTGCRENKSKFLLKSPLEKGSEGL